MNNEHIQSSAEDLRRHTRAHTHVPALDGVRGLAILLVMADHFTVMTGTTPLDRWIIACCREGKIGVDLFFVLSGFLITGILLDARGQAGYFRNFYGRRVLRIFPLYYAVVLFSLVILPRLPNSKSAAFGRINGSELWYWVHLSNFSIALHNGFRHGILDVSWSLAIEEQFYLVWPAIVFLLSPRQLGRVCLAIICVALLMRTGLALSAANDISLYVLTPCRMDGLATGALIAIIARIPSGAQYMVRAAPAIIFIAASTSLAMIIWRVATNGMTGLVGYGAIKPQAAERIYQSIIYTSLAIAFGGLLALAAFGAPSSFLVRAFSVRPLRLLGKYSYAIYLFNLPLRALVRDAIFPPARFPRILGSQLPGQLIFYVLASVFVIFAAMVSWHLFEKHFLKMKRLFPMKKEPSDALPLQVG